MKSLVLHFEDEEFEELKRAKGKLTWRTFFLALLHNLKKEVGNSEEGMQD